MNAFEVLGISTGFSIDSKALRSSFIRKQRSVHPDHFADGSEVSELANRAYELLKDELSRARHLLELQGVDEKSCPLNPTELMAWMELGEEMEMGSDADCIENLFSEREAFLDSLKAQLLSIHTHPYTERECALLAQWVQGESYRRRLRKIQAGEQEI